MAKTFCVTYVLIYVTQLLCDPNFDMRSENVFDLYSDILLDICSDIKSDILFHM